MLRRDQREYGCGHVRYIAARWCQTYAQTQKPCPLKVTYFEYL